MTLSVPSFLAAATSLVIPPPADADVTVAQLVLPLDDDEEPEGAPGGGQSQRGDPERVKR